MRILVILAALLLFVVPAQADTFAGYSECTSAATRCSTTNKIKEFAKKKAQQSQGCDYPEAGTSCGLIEGERYIYHVQVRYGSWPNHQVVHYQWWATVFDTGTHPAHIVIWNDENLVAVETNYYCGLHP